MSNESQSMMLPVQIRFKKENEFRCYECDNCPFLKNSGYYHEDDTCLLFKEKMKGYVCSSCSDFICRSLRNQREES